MTSASTLPGMNDERIYCSELAATDVMAGSVDPVDVWLLLEYRPAWAAKAIVDNDLQAPIRDWLDQQIANGAARGRKVRPQFIRQPERDSVGVTLLVGDASGLRRFDVTTYDELLAIDIDAAAPRVDVPLYFVCTNGRRDLCCARFGLPTYAALRAEVGDRVWQTTHVGGHRFAPNVLVLPQGALYGRVTADAAPRFVAAIDRGLAFDWLRGVSFEAGAVQAGACVRTSRSTASRARGACGVRSLARELRGWPRRRLRTGTGAHGPGQLR
ncbi:MAG: sucrase ferredoxin [Gammaproteobacteria bacterium]|nr:sucrase ferredoxin [Gammaproteobacteria bacterium]